LLIGAESTLASQLKDAIPGKTFGSLFECLNSCSQLRFFGVFCICQVRPGRFALRKKFVQSTGILSRLECPITNWALKRLRRLRDACAKNGLFLLLGSSKPPTIRFWNIGFPPQGERACLIVAKCFCESRIILNVLPVSISSAVSAGSLEPAVPAFA
jgi:hypothetical protein